MSIEYDNSSNLHVAVKKSQLPATDPTFFTEIEMLKKFNSPFIVRHYEMLQTGNEIVVIFGREDDGIEYDGALSLRLSVRFRS